MIQVSVWKLGGLIGIVVFFTVIGLFASVYAGTLGQDSALNSVLTFVGFTFLWPYQVFAAVENLTRSDYVFFSYAKFALSQMIGWTLLLFVCELGRRRL